MILNYRFENFLSFQDRVNFSMMAPKSKVKNRFPDNYNVSNVGVDILKTAVMVGENAGGKSNFVRSLFYLRSFFVETGTAKAYRNMINTNNIQESCPKKSKSLQSFEIEVVIKENILYLYQLEIDFAGVVKEAFYFKNHAQKKYKKIFSLESVDREIECENENECTSGNKCQMRVKADYLLDVPGADNEIEESLAKTVNKEKALGLTITRLAMLGDEDAIAFTEWIKDDLCPETNIINYDIYKSMRNGDEDLEILHDPRYLEIFQMIDQSIIDFRLDEEKPFSKTIVVRKKRNGGTFTRELSQDSSGVREFFAWAVQIYKVVYENKVIFADEMDRVFNPVLSDRIISFICGKKHYGQFIFTTHNALHLDLKNYMKEQIYFVTKDIETLESELYSLADFPEIRYETTKVYEFYMKGILGGTAVE